jgi:hypothetical protein
MAVFGDFSFQVTQHVAWRLVPGMADSSPQADPLTFPLATVFVVVVFTLFSIEVRLHKSFRNKHKYKELLYTLHSCSSGLAF